MLKNIWGKEMDLRDWELRNRRDRNRDYMMKLKSDNLLLNFKLEAGRYTAAYHPEGIHGGWEAQTCELRGHFLGHWLSAAAMRYYATGDIEIKAKADVIVHELALCQKENGGQWVGSIPEKYLHWIAKGKSVWAPHYTLHKTLMGLADMHEYAGNKEALEVASNFADWFLDWSAGFSREKFDDILDVETGGMLEVWAQLLDFTGEEKYRTLLERYYRSRLFHPLLRGEDVLANMHANTTIPEVLGCARAYEVTGEQKWRDIVEAYWKSAVTERGQYATGGQTSGEIWSARGELGARLGDKNQEHCTVYNMLRLADYLFRWTKDPVYADYIEMGIYNGLMAQAYWRRNGTNGQSYDTPNEGLISYFLPLKPGAKKGWGSETNDFWCCHGTLVQANAEWERGILYQENSDIYLAQYFDFAANLDIDGNNVRLSVRRDSLNGDAQKYPRHPECLAEIIEVQTQTPADFALHIRLPWWIKGKAVIYVNEIEEIQTDEKTAFYTIKRTWTNGDIVRVFLPQGINIRTLPEAQNMAAFLYGPILLAGLCGEERQLVLNGKSPEEILTHDNEREWGSWKNTFKTTGQERGISFIPLYTVGYETYTIYFPLKK